MTFVFGEFVSGPSVPPPAVCEAVSVGLVSGVVVVGESVVVERLTPFDESASSRAD